MYKTINYCISYITELGDIPRLLITIPKSCRVEHGLLLTQCNRILDSNAIGLQRYWLLKVSMVTSLIPQQKATLQISLDEICPNIFLAMISISGPSKTSLGRVIISITHEPPVGNNNITNWVFVLIAIYNHDSLEFVVLHYNSIWCLFTYVR